MDRYNVELIEYVLKRGGQQCKFQIMSAMQVSNYKYLAFHTPG